MMRNLDFQRVFVMTEGDGDFKVLQTPHCG